MDATDTTTFQFNNEQIATLIADRLATNTTFQDRLIKAITDKAANDARNLEENSYFKLRKVYDTALQQVSDRVPAAIEKYSESMRLTAEKTLREKFERTIRDSSNPYLDHEVIHKQAKHVIECLIKEAFGRRAHVIAQEALSTNKLELLFEEARKNIRQEKA